MHLVSDKLIFRLKHNIWTVQTKYRKNNRKITKLSKSDIKICLFSQNKNEKFPKYDNKLCKIGNKMVNKM